MQKVAITDTEAKGILVEFIRQLQSAVGADVYIDYVLDIMDITDEAFEEAVKTLGNSDR